MSVEVRGMAKRAAAAAEFIRCVALRTQLLGPPGNPPQAWILLDPNSEDVGAASGGRCVVWLSDPNDLAASLPPSAAVVTPVTPGGRAPAGVLGFPDPGADVRRQPHLTPALRERWRRAGGLPREYPVDLWRRGEAALTDLDRSQVLLASAVAARGPLALAALAAGAPLVTDPTTATHLRLGDGDQALIVGEGGRTAALESLVSDPERAAVLSLAGRRHAEQWLDRGPAADAASRTLAPTTSGPAVSALADRLVELGVPLDPSTVDRVARCLALFTTMANLPE